MNSIKSLKALLILLFITQQSCDMPKDTNAPRQHRLDIMIGKKVRSVSYRGNEIFIITEFAGIFDTVIITSYKYPMEIRNDIEKP